MVLEGFERFSIKAETLCPSHLHNAPNGCITSFTRFFLHDVCKIPEGINHKR